MNPRQSGSPMDRDYQNTGPYDPTSPFRQTAREAKPSETKLSPFTPQLSSSTAKGCGSGEPPPFRNPAFRTPWKPFQEVRWPEEADEVGLGYAEEQQPKSPSGKGFLPDQNVSLQQPPRMQNGTGEIPRRQISDPPDRSLSRNTSQLQECLSSEGESPKEKEFEVLSTTASRKKHPTSKLRRRTSESLAWTFSNAGRERCQSTLYAFTLLVALCISGNFYYKVVSVSTSALWAYLSYVFYPDEVVLEPSDPPRLVRLQTCTLSLVKTLGLLILVSWCAMISPAHIFMPTIMDAWTKYSDHAPFKSFEVLHDPGDTTSVE